MKHSSSSIFRIMDQYSESAMPFFFIINFLADEAEVFSEKELTNSGIEVDFPNYKTNKNPAESGIENIEWKAYPCTKEAYEKGFNMVQKHLRRGDSYLVNYTAKTLVETNLSLKNIFDKAEAKYKMLYPNKFVFFSPETFVEIKDNVISTCPMKGTIDADIPDAEQKLKNDTKEKAEHYTVVDLLRNDLSMVADEVRLKHFQRIDYLKTTNKNLYAMSSDIEGIIKPKYRKNIGSLLEKLLPAGSILGAPKPKTLEIILEAEDYERGYYTGICGYFDGKDLDTCVMIRFIENHDGKLYFKSGGGITHMSDLDSEYEEMKNKIYVPIY
ncbi:aminodeoxychorismate synthase component I [Riemerella columbipharyngis]|nr:aminodeoxychorismate synthase component I [Riemerella columbipharyngis]